MPDTLDDFICDICNAWDDDMQNGVCSACSETCEHGMSAWLCMGPNHYPSRQDEMEGRYF